MQIQQVPLASIIPYPNNARTHGTAQIELLAGSIQEFGFDQPIVLDSNNVIVKGHGRYQAAKRLGLETVPAIVVEDLSPAQVRASRIADNRIAELSNWDRELLESEIDILIEDGFDVSLLGFGDEDDMSLPGEVGGDTRTVGLEPMDSSTKEINTDDFKLDHECPRCGFEFND